MTGSVSIYSTRTAVFVFFKMYEIDHMHPYAIHQNYDRGIIFFSL